MTKISQACASLIKFFMLLRRGTMQEKLKSVSTLAKCSKLEVTTWIVGCLMPFSTILDYILATFV
jgi:hypothetical protein